MIYKEDDKVLISGVVTRKDLEQLQEGVKSFDNYSWNIEGYEV